ncbi:MAG: TAXI family TRAP transporter solute-binding subunit [Deltaproteobacteria bacterium]|nr:TAXI family TRAP transporter solute-binding subunit [Deltaproteobacteria bacterium]
MLKKKPILLCLVTVLALSVVFAGPAMAAKKFFAVATGGTGGTYYPLGGALAQALSSKIPDLIVTAQSGNASTANLNLIRSHGIESAFVQNNTAYQAYTGIDQFKGNPVKNVRGIASLYPEVIQIVTLKSANIKSVKELKGKRVIPGDRGSGTAVDAENIMQAAGMTFKDFGALDWLSFTGISQRMKDGQADAGFITAGIPTSSVMELTSQTDIAILDIDDALIKKTTDKWPFYAKVTIPAGTYRGQDAAVDTVAVMAQWVVDAVIPEDIVYQITVALWEKGKHVLRQDDAPSAAAIMGQVHAKGKDVTLETALDGMAIPLHSGAAKYYKEKGLIK